MRKVVLISGLVIGAVVVAIAWQIASIKLNNIEFHDELRDIAEQRGANIGLVAPKTDDEVRGQVVRAAVEHGFDIEPDQVTLERITNGLYAHFNLKVDYTARVNLLVCSFNLHFTQTSAP